MFMSIVYELVSMICVGEYSICVGEYGMRW